jgi:MerR family transcriptional regulator, light-induced transcriptional regulator
VDILSTRSVAEMLGVSEATVKRWSDAGTLKCFRTPGGHRKFRLRDVKSFLSDQSPEEAVAARTAMLAPIGQPNPLLHKVATLAHSADVDGLVSFVADRRLEGMTLAQIVDQYLFALVRQLGEERVLGRLPVAQEHVALNTILDGLVRAKPMVLSGGDRGRALVAAVGSDRQELTLFASAVVLDADGFRTATLGGGLPAADMALMIAGAKASLIVLVVPPSSNAEYLRGDIAVLTSSANASGSRVLVFAPFSNGSNGTSTERLSTFVELAHHARLGATSERPESRTNGESRKNGVNGASQTVNNV